MIRTPAMKTAHEVVLSRLNWQGALAELASIERMAIEELELLAMREMGFGMSLSTACGAIELPAISTGPSTGNGGVVPTRSTRCTSSTPQGRRARMAA